MDNKETIVQIQRFTASSISMLNLLKETCSKQQDQDLSEKMIRSRDKFISTSESIIDNMKDPDEEFDFTRFIKKAFSTLKTKSSCELLINKDEKLFEIRDESNKIQTILPGLDLKVGYGFLTDSEKITFWQYMYLFSSSVFRMMKSSNEESFERKYSDVIESMKKIEDEIAKTGIMFNNHIFNPFIGVGDDKKGQMYGVNELFTGGELPKQQNVSIESVLSMLGIDKMFDEEKLHEELKNFSDENATEATARIASLLGANNNPEVMEVCNMLIKDIVKNFKETGLSNIGETLANVAENAKKTIDQNKMAKTAKSMQYFMQNSKELMSSMKDANGNPIGEQLMNSMSIPLSMMNMMTKNMDQDNKSDQSNQPNLDTIAEELD